MLFSLFSFEFNHDVDFSFLHCRHVYFITTGAFVWDQSGIRIIGIMQVSVRLAALPTPEYLDFNSRIYSYSRIFPNERALRLVVSRLHGYYAEIPGLLVPDSFSIFFLFLFFFFSDRPTQNQKTHSTINEKKKGMALSTLYNLLWSIKSSSGSFSHYFF